MMMNQEFSPPKLETSAIEAKFWAAHAAYLAATDAFNVDTSEEGSRRHKKLYHAHVNTLETMLAMSTETALGVLAKFQVVKEGGCTMLDLRWSKPYSVLDVIMWDVERLANQGLRFVPWQVGGEFVAQGDAVESAI